MTASLARLLWLLIFAATLATPAFARAAAPWQGLNLFRRVPADPDVDYLVTENNGPWMILATTFSGEGAEQQARELVLELRRDFRLSAYLYERTVDHSKPIRGLGFNRNLNSRNRLQPKTMRYLRHGPRPRSDRHGKYARSKEIAVMVGDYRSVDDRRAQKDLEKIKHIVPAVLDFRKVKTTNQQLALLRTGQRHVLKSDNKKKKRGPMGHAFMVSNPLLPEQAFTSRGVDRAVEKLNRGFQYNLLKCKGKYTVQVATFTGNVTINPSKIRAYEQGQKIPNRLGDAARDAHKICLALRKLGYEAYEFHERQSSIVTVGSFESVGTPRRDGKIEINPTIHKIIKTFQAKDLNQAAQLTRNRLAAHRQPHVVAGIALDLQPVPVKVPRRSFGADYAHRPLVRR